MGRSLLFAEANINNSNIAIGTVHLESLEPYALIRWKQLELIYKIYEQFPTAILMGDFNFDNASENKNIKPSYIDVWKHLHPEEPGHTMKAIKHYAAWRPDRIILKNNPYWAPSKIEMVG